MFKKCSAVALIMIIFFTYLNFPVASAANKLVRLTKVRTSYKQEEKFTFVLKNGSKKERVKFNKNKNRIVITFPNMHLKKSINDRRKNKVASFKEKSKFVKNSKLKIHNSKKRIGRATIRLKKNVSYNWVQTNKDIVITLKQQKTNRGDEPRVSPTPIVEPTGISPDPTLDPESTVGPDLSPTIRPTATPTNSKVVTIKQDQESTLFSVPKAAKVQINYTRQFRSNGKGGLKLRLSGLGSKLELKNLQSLNAGIMEATGETLTSNRTNINIDMKSWQYDFVSVVESNILLISMNKSAIQPAVYNGAARKGNYRINIPYTDKLDYVKSKDGLEHTISGPVKEFPISDGQLTPNDGLIKSISSTNDGTTRTLVMVLERELVVKLVKKSGFFRFDFATPEASKERLVVLDAGHGGHDPGAVGYYTKKVDGKTVEMKALEKEINLDIVLRLDKLLTDAGVRVELTRYDDTYKSLDYRYNMANDLKADMFLSVHQNAATSTAARGTETYYYKNKNSNKGITDKTFAENIQKCIVNKLNRNTSKLNRGVKQASFAVIRETKMLATLAEVQFITNQQDRDMILKANNRQKVAEALCEAILISIAAMK